MEPKCCLILNVLESSLELDRRVPGFRDEFPFPLPSCFYRAILSRYCTFPAKTSLVCENLLSHNSLKKDDNNKFLAKSHITYIFTKRSRITNIRWKTKTKHKQWENAFLRSYISKSWESSSQIYILQFSFAIRR